MKKFILTIMFACAAVAVWAQGGPRLVVWQKSGEKVTFNLHDQPETTFGGGKLMIRTNTTSVEYQLENVLRYTYESLFDGIELQPNEQAVEVTPNGDAVTFRGLKTGATVQLYSINGALIDQCTATGQPLTISVSGKPTGIYIVKSGAACIKLMKK